MSKQQAVIYERLTELSEKVDSAYEQFHSLVLELEQGSSIPDKR